MFALTLPDTGGVFTQELLEQTHAGSQAYKTKSIDWSRDFEPFLTFGFVTITAFPIFGNKNYFNSHVFSPICLKMLLKTVQHNN